MFTLSNYTVFESIRKNKEKGGSMLGVHAALKPVLISEYNEKFELIVVEIVIASKEIRVITGYGPQENWNNSEKTPFYNALEDEIVASGQPGLQGRSIIIAMDANAKLGPDLVPGDPHKQSQNGKILADIVERHAFCVVNSLVEKQKGLITRKKSTMQGERKSIIDFVIVSSDLIKHIEEIHIDDERQHDLTKNIQTKGSLVYCESDQNIIITKLKMIWFPQESKTFEVFKYNDKEGKAKFKSLTTNTKQLSEIIDMKKSIHVVTKMFLKRLKGFIHESFRKVKIVDKKTRI